MVVMKHPHADKLEILYDFKGNTIMTEMKKIDDYTFFFEGVANTRRENNFNLRATIYDNNYERNVWLISERGINASLISINNIKIADDFIIDSEKLKMPALAFKLNNENEFQTVEENRIIINKSIPPELITDKQLVRIASAPDQFPYALPWMQALYMGDNEEQSTVDLDYLKLYAMVSGTAEIILSDEYFYPPSSTFIFKHGKLFNRYPFFYNEADTEPMLVFSRKNGIISFHPDEKPNRVWHWWGSKRIKVPESADYLILEARVKITGPAIVQPGLDFWNSEKTIYGGYNVNNTESGIGNVYFASDDWQIIRFNLGE